MLNYREDNKKNRFRKLLDFASEHVISIIVAVAIIAGIIGTIAVMTGEHEKRQKEQQGDYAYKPAHVIYLPASEAKNFNPLSSDSEDIHQINQLIYSSLFTLDKSLNVVPQLTESYEADPDKGQVKIKLRTDARFSDGSDMTAEDIKFTVNQIKEIGESSPYFTYVDRIDNVEVLGGSLFNITFKSESDAALDNLIFPIVSAKDYSEKKNFPLSSGRYMCTKYKKDEKIYLEPDKYFFGKKGGKNVEFQLLENRDMEIGLMTMDSVTAAKTSNVDVANDIENRDLKSTRYTSNRLEYMGFNCRKGAFKNRFVRQAISKGINTKALVEDCYAGSAVQSPTIYWPGFLGSSNDFNKIDLKKCQELMAKGGYKTLDKEGYFSDESGNRLEAVLLTDNENFDRKESAQAIADQLKSAGVKITVDAVSREEYIKRLKSGKFDMYLGGMAMDKQFRLSELFSAGNYAGFDDAVTLDRVKGLERCMGDKELTEQFKKVKKSLDQQMPYLPICYHDDYLISVKTLSSKDKPLFFNQYQGIETWKWQLREPVKTDKKDKKDKKL